MNERFLSKAKRIDNNDWVTGYYIYHINRTLCVIGDKLKPEDEDHVIMRDGFSDWNMPRDTIHFIIDPNTLCQCTGLKDKKGVLIFEGDVMLYSEYVIVIVGYDLEKGCYSFAFHNGIAADNYEKDCFDYEEMHYSDFENMEVIGNIHDKDGD